MLILIAWMSRKSDAANDFPRDRGVNLCFLSLIVSVPLHQYGIGSSRRTGVQCTHYFEETDKMID
jgi:hypothetical protein